MPGNFCSNPKTHILQVLSAEAPTDSEYLETIQSTQDDIDCAAGLSGACANLITDIAQPATTIVQGSGASVVVSEGTGDGQTYEISPAFTGFDQAGVTILRIAEMFTIANVGTLILSLLLIWRWHWISIFTHHISTIVIRKIGFVVAVRVVAILF